MKIIFLTDPPVSFNEKIVLHYFQSQPILKDNSVEKVKVFWKKMPQSKKYRVNKFHDFVQKGGKLKCPSW